MKAHIQIVGWNHFELIGTCILSCKKQTTPVPIVFVDNNSSDSSVEYVKKNYPDVIVVENKNNRGYAGGHNDGMKKVADSDVVICLNPDVVLENDFVEKILECFKGDEKIGAVVPLLFRNKKRDKDGVVRTIVDSYGTFLKKGLNVENLNEGKFWPDNVQVSKKDKKYFFNEVEPWGFTGAAVALSRIAINSLRDENGNFFDEDLHSYREDVDASWRLLNSGWKIVGTRDARAWHSRVARKGERKSAWVARLSWRNYFLVIIKNVSRKIILNNLPLFSIQVCARILQFVFEPNLWGGLPKFLSLIPVFIKKRRIAL